LPDRRKGDNTQFDLADLALSAFAVSRGSRRPAAGFPQEKGPSADGRLAFPDVWEP